MIFTLRGAFRHPVETLARSCTERCRRRHKSKNVSTSADGLCSCSRPTRWTPRRRLASSIFHRTDCRKAPKVQNVRCHSMSWHRKKGRSKRARERAARRVIPVGVGFGSSVAAACHRHGAPGPRAGTERQQSAWELGDTSSSYIIDTGCRCSSTRHLLSFRSK